MIADPDGTERYRFEGYLPPEDFLAPLEMGLAQAAFANQRFEEAERRFRSIVGSYPNSEVAPAALYWAGVARYKGTNDASALADTAKQFQGKYTDSSWATKSSVWL